MSPSRNVEFRYSRAGGVIAPGSGYLCTTKSKTQDVVSATQIADSHLQLTSRAAPCQLQTWPQIDRIFTFGYWPGLAGFSIALREDFTHGRPPGNGENAASPRRKSGWS